MTAVVDRDRARLRRRGSELEAAILAAATDELIAVGYGCLTMEGVAARAHTGKASVYRRWPSKQALVLETLQFNMPCAPEVEPGAGADADQWADLSTREIMIVMGLQMADNLRGRVGQLAFALAGESSRDPELGRLLELEFVDRKCDGIVDVLRRGVLRGEVRPEAVTRRVAGVAPALIMHEVFMFGREPDRAWVAAIIDEVLLPIIEPRCCDH